jgi:hypothetical protein
LRQDAKSNGRCGKIEYRNIKGDADIKEEKAELMKAHRLCLQKYEGDPAGQKERCAPYAQAIQDIEKRGK